MQSPGTKPTRQTAPAEEAFERAGPANPYAKFADADLILRDQLAIDRTILANERTLLAYARTCLALILTGAGAVKFFDGLASDAAGWTLIGLGLAIAVVGLWRSLGMARNIGAVNRKMHRE
ncbi:MAG: DUF202 domain-containing protein [Lentisphaerae bacterium]|nr:DUF202 domain-containing protein [Lentisphaerota bacterium]